jgi:hypothetical protein
LGDESLLAWRLSLHTREVAQETAKEGCKDRLGRFVCYRGGWCTCTEGMSRSDLKEIGEMLHESDAASIVVGDHRAGY